MKLTINKLVNSMTYRALIFSFLGILTTGRMEAAAIGAPLAPSATFSTRVDTLMRSYPEVRLECVVYHALQGQSLQAAADTIIDILLSDNFETLLSVSSNFEQWFNDRGDKFKHTVMLASIVAFAGKKDDFVRRINSRFASWHSTYDYDKFVIYFSALVNVLQANLASGSHYSLVDSLLYPANYQAFLTSIRASAFANEVVDFFMGLFLVSLENTFKNLYHSLGSTNFQGNFAPDFLDFFNRRTPGAQTLSTDPDRAFITLDYLKTLTITPAMPAAPTAAVAPAAPVLPTSAFTEITLKQTIRDALANNVIRYATPETSWNFTVRGASYTLRKPKGLTPIASDTFDTVVFAIQKLLTIYPGLAAASHIDPNLDEELGVFRQSIKAFDVYCFGTIAHQAIDHAIRTMVDFKIAADSSLATKELANKTHCQGAAGGTYISPGAKANLTAIGFPMNHGLGISHMFRPEYELPETYQGEISYFTRVFNVSDPVRPNYHVEELLYNMARGKAPGNGPKPKDLVESLSYQYKLLGKLLKQEIKYLKRFEEKYKATKPGDVTLKWKSFFENATNGACADEYLKCLAEWIQAEGSLSDALGVDVAAVATTDMDVVLQIVEGVYTTLSPAQKLQIKNQLITQGIFDADGNTDYTPGRALNSITNDIAFANQQRDLFFAALPFLKPILTQLTAQGQSPTAKELFLNAILEQDYD